MKVRLASACKRAVSIVVIAALGVGRSGAADPAIPADLQVAIIMRMLAYDRALKARAGKGIVIGLLSRASDRTSTEAHVAMKQAFDAQRTRDVRGLPLRVVSLAFKAPAELGAWIVREEVGIVYVPAGLDKELAAIRAVCSEHRVAAITPVRAFVDQRLPLGIVLKEDRPSIVVNLPAAQAVGMDLDPKLLALSQVVR